MRTSTRIYLTGVAALLTAGPVAWLTASPVSAHPTLASASPAIGSTVGPPSEIVLTYADPVGFTQVLVSDPAGHYYQSGKSLAVDNTVTQKVAPTLPDGFYTVAWRVVSADGHPVEGTYQFTVAGSTAAAPAPIPIGARPGTSSGAGVWWIGLVVLLAVGVGAGVVMLRRGLTADADL